MCGALAHVCFGPIADIPPLFDHLVGAGEQSGRDSQADGLRCLQIDYQLVLSWRLHWHLAGLLTLEDAIDVAGRLPVLIEEVGELDAGPINDGVKTAK
jgi:hypothetical protein